MRDAPGSLAMQLKLSYSKEVVIECIDNIRGEIFISTLDAPGRLIPEVKTGKTPYLRT